MFDLEWVDSFVLKFLWLAYNHDDQHLYQNVLLSKWFHLGKVKILNNLFTFKQSFNTLNSTCLLVLQLSNNGNLI